MNREQCPSTLDLWPEVVAEPSRLEVARHVARCRRCRLLIVEARRKMAVLRDARGSQDGECHQSAKAGTNQAAAFPAQIDDCPVLGVLGEGGQSIVYRAWHPRLNVEIAIKRLHGTDNFSDSALVHEALILSSLKSHAFPRPLDLRQIHGEAFLFLELIHGKPLSHCGPQLNPEQILEVMRDLLTAIRELHAAQLLHLDLSPANVLLDEDGNAGLIDFGLARRAHSSQEANLIVGGTPGFIAPELFDPQREIDDRADVYGAAAILHFLLHGEPPRRNSAESAPLRSELEADPLAIRLSCLCQRAIHVDPKVRCKSVDEFLAALDEVDGRWSRVRRWLTAGAVLGALLLGQNERLIDAAHAEILVVSPAGDQRLRESPSLHLGDRVAFSFAAAGSGADLVVRKPGGTLIQLQPFPRGPSGAFRFPPTGGAVLRQDRGTYVVFFIAPDTIATRDQLLRALGDLPPPPVLSAGENLVLSRSAAESAVLQQPQRGDAENWARAFVRCEHHFPGLVAIAFPVE